MTLTARQRDCYAKASAFVTADAVAEAAALLIDLRSPTGEEGALARAVVSRLRMAGIAAEEQALDAQQSNVVAKIAGRGGASLMLYAPVDTVTSDAPEEDLPWVGPDLTSELRGEARIEGDLLSGLGAQNPKGHAACALVAFEAIARAGIPLAGDLMLGLGAGGMPTEARPGTRTGSGHGAGCHHMMTHGTRPDMAIIAKSGWAVSWQEVGLAWYEIEVAGTHTYVGSRHLLPYSNAIANAAKVVLDLEKWFPDWTARTRSSLIAPQGVVSFIEGGWERMPAFTPAVCRLRCDLRLNPSTDFAEADGAVAEILATIGARYGVQMRWRRIEAIAGTATDPDSPVIRACIDAWEDLNGTPHHPTAGLSGATDANILRAHGVPTARVGLPKVDVPGIDFQRGMNTVSIADMVRLTRLLIQAAVRLCGEK